MGICGKGTKKPQLEDLERLYLYSIRLNNYVLARSNISNVQAYIDRGKQLVFVFTRPIISSKN